MIALPPALRRTGSKRDDGPAERLTFAREQARRVAAADIGATVSLPNGETFEVLDFSPDLTGRPSLVVRSQANNRKKAAMSEPSIKKPTVELPLVEVSVETHLVPGVNGGLGRLTVEVPLAPKPDSIAPAGVAGTEFALRYTDQAAFDAILATAEARGEAFFSVPDVPRVLSISAQQETARDPAGERFSGVLHAVDGGAEIARKTLERQEARRAREYDEMNRRQHSAQVEQTAIGDRRKTTADAINHIARLKREHPAEFATALDELATALANMTGEDS